MPGVSNSSPLIYLSALGDLDLLQRLFGSVSIPAAVFREVVVEGTGQPGAREVEAAMGNWLHLDSVRHPSAVLELMERSGIHRGEAEAIVLAGEQPLRLVILDDQAALSEATKRGLIVVRTPALYIAAKRAGIIANVKPKLDGLRQFGFRLRDEHYRLILERAGEI